MWRNGSARSRRRLLTSCTILAWVTVTLVYVSVACAAYSPAAWRFVSVHKKIVTHPIGKSFLARAHVRTKGNATVCGRFRARGSIFAWAARALVHIYTAAPTELFCASHVSVLGNMSIVTTFVVKTVHADTTIRVNWYRRIAARFLAFSSVFTWNATAFIHVNIAAPRYLNPADTPIGLNEIVITKPIRKARRAMTRVYIWCNAAC
jgi:hypothetical protein